MAHPTPTLLPISLILIISKYLSNILLLIDKSEEEWIKKPFFEDVEWEYADYEVFHRTFFVERNTDSVNPTIEDISNGVWNNA